jgi:hemoglobin-like flavoprotein
MASLAAKQAVVGTTCRRGLANSAQTIDIVKATAPVVGAHALEITTCFYKTLFKNDPAALHFFNEANQVRRTER